MRQPSRRTWFPWGRISEMYEDISDMERNFVNNTKSKKPDLLTTQHLNIQLWPFSIHWWSWRQSDQLLSANTLCCLQLCGLSGWKSRMGEPWLRGYLDIAACVLRNRATSVLFKPKCGATPSERTAVLLPSDAPASSELRAPIPGDIEVRPVLYHSSYRGWWVKWSILMYLNLYCPDNYTY